MNQIDNLTGNPNQTTHGILDDGSVVDITLTYRPAIKRWQIDISHPDITLKGKLLCVHPNILRQYRNSISFGIMCLSKDKVDPMLADDFESGRISLYVLSSDEVEGVEKLLGSGSAS